MHEMISLEQAEFWGHQRMSVFPITFDSSFVRYQVYTLPEILHFPLYRSPRGLYRPPPPHLCYRQGSTDLFHVSLGYRLAVLLWGVQRSPPCLLGSALVLSCRGGSRDLHVSPGHLLTLLLSRVQRSSSGLCGSPIALPLGSTDFFHVSLGYRLALLLSRSAAISSTSSWVCPRSQLPWRVQRSPCLTGSPPHSIAVKGPAIYVRSLWVFHRSRFYRRSPPIHWITAPLFCRQVSDRWLLLGRLWQFANVSDASPSAAFDLERSTSVWAALLFFYGIPC